MLSWDLFRHYLLSRRAGAVVRSVAKLCIAGVAIGVAALVVVLSVMNGFNDSIRRKLLAVEPHLTVTVPGLSTEGALNAHPAKAVLDQARARAGAENLRFDFFEAQDILLRTTEGVYGGAVARGVDPEALAYVLNESRRANFGRARPGEAAAPDLSPESLKLDEGEAIIGVDLAKSLGLFEGDRAVAVAPEALLLPPGEAPPFERLTIKKALVSNVADIDSKVLFYPRGKALVRLRESASREIGFEVRMKDLGALPALQARLQATGAKVSNWQERNSTLFYALRLERFAMSAVLTTAALIAGLSIVTVLVLLLTQKKKDIGALMAMGLSRAKTQRAFVGLGLILGFAGIGGGLAIGLGICFVIDRYPLPILPEVYYEATIPATIDPWLVAGVLIVAFVIAALSAWLPVRAHSRLEPADALRARDLGGH